MNSRSPDRRVWNWSRGLGIVALACVMMSGSTARAGLLPEVDPAQVVPLDKIAPASRESVAEVIRDHTLRRKSAADTFPCNPKIYLCLLNEPAITLGLWQNLSTSSVRLHQVAPNRYEGSDGAGATGIWEFVYRSPKLHVMLCNLNYVTPRGNARLDARIVLVIHTGYYKEVNGEPWIQHDIEAFVKVDSKGWGAVARTIRPVIEKLLEEQIQEAGWFVSLMGRLVSMHPDWANQTTTRLVDVPAETRERFREVVIKNRKAGASTGRPVMVENTDPKVKTR